MTYSPFDYGFILFQFLRLILNFFENFLYFLMPPVLLNPKQNNLKQNGDQDNEVICYVYSL